KSVVISSILNITEDRPTAAENDILERQGRFRTTCTCTLRVGTAQRKGPPFMLASFRRVLTPTAVVQLLVGWLGFVALTIVQPVIQGSLTTPLLFGLLAAIVAVIILCAFGVVTQAERLAHRLGDPYGTLELTLSIVIIEVILISAVMLGPGDHQTIARDSVM